MTKKTIKAWAVMDEHGEPLGKGQGYMEYFYRKSAAEMWLEIYRDDVKRVHGYGELCLKWKIVPVEIRILPACPKAKTKNHGK